VVIVFGRYHGARWWTKGAGAIAVASSERFLRSPGALDSSHSASLYFFAPPQATVVKPTFSSSCALLRRTVICRRS
jgi:hypothetical protein